MYAPFFGLSKEPFSIAPDPRFLFMSDQHREALAHLLYGVSGGGGFVLLTGTIGAGKTTVCRAFLDQVPAHCAVAYIFNPKLTAVELLQTVCEEFGVELPQPAAPGLRPSAKEYVDALNRYLLAAHAAGGHTVLIIDEAQSLAADVLEQLRLLTNLETAEKKLLQIVLIGQPELRDMLARPDLEQLAQRVIARYHLAALTAAETAQYIQHRLAVAAPSGMGPGLRDPFDSRAVARVHQLTGGVPRRINLLCDRAMLGAYAHGQPRVTAQMVEKAAREVFGDVPPARAAATAPRPALLAAGAGVAALALLAALAWGGLWWRGQAAAPALAGAPAGVPAERTAAAPALDPGVTLGTAANRTPAAAAASATTASAPAGLAGPASALPDGLPPPAAAALPLAASAPALPLLGDPAPVLAAAWADEAAALRDLARLWQSPLAEGDPCERAAAAGLQCHRAGTGLGVLRQLARPAVLLLRGEENAVNTGVGRSAPSYAILLSVGATGATLAVGEQRWRLSLPALARVWRGEFITYWRTPPGWRSGIDPVEDPQLQTWLLQHLGQSGGLVPGVPLREQVRNFQVANGLQADGRAGPLTLMLLGRADEPQLMQDR